MRAVGAAHAARYIDLRIPFLPETALVCYLNMLGAFLK